MSLAIELDKHGYTYLAGEAVKGTVIVTCNGGTSHNGVTLEVNGAVSLQLSPRKVGIFEAFHNNIKPLQLIHFVIPLADRGKLPDGQTTLPFEFPLRSSNPSYGLFETYHGVFVNVMYTITAEMQRGLFSKDQKVCVPFVVMNPEKPAKTITPKSVAFTMEPQNLKNLRGRSLDHVPRFRIRGLVHSVICDITKPFTGFIRVEHCDTRILTIELQLVRVEFCAAEEGVAKEATEIQNIQIAEGDVCRGVDIPLHMVFPRCFTCPTLIASNFKVEFEVNVIVILEDPNGPGNLPITPRYQVTDNFPIEIHRPSS
mmetsp:Transcript_39564/g.70970  ORF Transcript_39564/g.70970 Transcript_39564/m.70970 type:complete len:313 (-) Transcript_39564:579-1517(-)